MKNLTLLLFIFAIVSLLIGCGAGGGPIDESDNETLVSFNIPESGAILSGDGVLSTEFFVTERRVVSQTITLSGGNVGTFNGVTQGTTLTGNYTFDIQNNLSTGNLTLRFNDVDGLFSNAQMILAINFTSIDPLSGRYIGTLTKDLFEDVDDFSSEILPDLEGTIIGLE